MFRCPQGFSALGNHSAIIDRSWVVKETNLSCTIGCRFGVLNLSFKRHYFYDCFGLLFSFQKPKFYPDGMEQKCLNNHHYFLYQYSCNCSSASGGIWRQKIKSFTVDNFYIVAICIGVVNAPVAVIFPVERYFLSKWFRWIQ